MPHIVASCFGVFDKFPLQNTYSGIRRNRYDVDCYTYVGAKASGNMFSVSAIIFQLLNNLLSISGTSTFLKIMMRCLLLAMKEEYLSLVSCSRRFVCLMKILQELSMII